MKFRTDEPGAERPSPSRDPVPARAAFTHVGGQGGEARYPIRMPLTKPARAAMFTVLGTLAAAAVGAALLVLYRQTASGHDDSIEPRAQPASAADIHVASGRPGEGL